MTLNPPRGPRALPAQNLDLSHNLGVNLDGAAVLPAGAVVQPCLPLGAVEGHPEVTTVGRLTQSSEATYTCGKPWRRRRWNLHRWAVGVTRALAWITCGLSCWMCLLRNLPPAGRACSSRLESPRRVKHLILDKDQAAMTTNLVKLE